ncbi:AMP-binding protein [uncultured Microscilla sp.]|uniref:AMP-binding protein n=1 Tax=uncultured Microscilla sp. TaxID=432653 RepID=UPI002620FEB5|nr:AMP-binding protein [uncultured Microscilla sp.]
MADFPWHQKYPKGIVTEIDPDKYSSVVAIIEESFQKFANKPAYSNMGVDLSYAQIDQASRNFAAYLQSLGLKKGDRIGLQMPNLLQYPVALFGALRAGLVVVNVNPLYTVREMVHQYNDAGVETVVILANFADKLQKTLPETKIKNVIVTEVGDMLGAFKGLITNFVVKHFKKMVPAFRIPGMIRFKDTLRKGQSMSFTKPELVNTDTAFLQYTGGTTGVSKGAILSHRNIVANLTQNKAWFIGLAEGKEIMITALPLYHVFALTVNCLLMAHVGAKSVLITNPRDMPGFVKTLIQNPPTLFTGLNTLFNGLLNTDGFTQVDWSHTKFVVAGGMAVQKPVAERWEKATGIQVAEGYGLSETSPVLSCNPLDGNARIGCIGLPLPSTELKILDDDGQEVAQGEPGEICARGPQIMSGYHGRPDETAKTFFSDNWFRTGDIGLMEPDGFFRIVDRKKDMILVSGFNVYPNEVEDVVAGHDGVLEVAAIGIPDAKATERVKVYIVKKDANLTQADVIDYCKNNLAGYKVPKEVEFREDLPKSNVGKILRKKLKDELKQV